MLDARNISAGYGSKTVLHDVSVRIATGEIVAIIGANGAGKSTLINTLVGAITATQGAISLDEQPITGLPAYATAKRGLIQVPEGRQVFAPLTVRENLALGSEALGPRGKPLQADWDQVFNLFPKLHERQEQKAGSLSGGEQQMLAIGRALMGRPRVLLLDEPSLGLAPVITIRMFEVLKEINAATGLTMLVVEQNAQRALDLASRAYVLERGRIVREGSSQALRSDPAIRAIYLGGD
jgi:branched-chain amino acid transport system ATP-binding protein